MVRCALFAALMAVCAWICVPLGDIAFTMQTLGLFLTLGILGGKWGTVSILSYLLLGAAGLPVFSGFRGGVGMLLGPTGGFLVGFLAMALLFWLITALLGEKCRFFALLFGQLLCYGCGAAWFAFSTGNGIFPALMLCIVPYLLPDGVKLTLAWLLTKRLRRRMQI